MSQTPRVAATMLLSACLLAAPFRISNAGPEYDAIKKINDEINRARKQFPSDVGGALDAEAAAIKKLESGVSDARAGLTDALKSEKAAYESVSNNLADIEAWLAHVKLSHACNQARAKILTEHGAGKQADAALFAALQATVDRFAKDARAAAKADVGFWTTQVGKLRAADDRVAVAIAKRLADESARAADARTEELYLDAKAKLEILVGLNKAARPITAQAVSDLEVASRALEKVDPAAARFYLDERVRFAIEHHWSKADTEAHEAIVLELDGLLVVAKGTSKIKKLAVRIKAEADKCYLLLMRFRSWSGSEAVEEFQWKMAGRDTALQEFHIGRYKGWKGLTTRGFCTTHPAKVNAKAKIIFPGNKNAVRYLGFEFERSAFPPALAAQLIVDSVDHCDPKAWTELWSDPVPGTLAFLDNEPVIIKEGGIDQGVEYWTAGSPMTKRVAATKLTTSPPGAVVFKSKLAFGTCPDDDSRGRIRSAHSRKLAKCRAKIDRKYGGRWRKIERLREAAMKQGDISPKAEKLAAKLEAKQGSEHVARCGPIANKAEADFGKAFHDLVDALTTKTPAATLDRAALLRAYDKTPMPR